MAKGRIQLHYKSNLEPAVCEEYSHSGICSLSIAKQRLPKSLGFANLQGAFLK